jgi:hypothetical protein
MGSYWLFLGRVLLFSVGTGHGVKKLPQGTLKDYKGWDWGFFVVEKVNKYTSI